MQTLLSVFLETANGPSQCRSSSCLMPDLPGSASREKGFRASLMPRSISVSVVFVYRLGFGSVSLFSTTQRQIKRVDLVSTSTICQREKRLKKWGS